MNISSNVDAIAYKEEELDAGSDVTPKGKPFSGLKDVLPETLKAIQALQTHRPAVQEGVQSLLPDLAATTLSPTAPNFPPPTISSSVHALAQARH